MALTGPPSATLGRHNETDPAAAGLLAELKAAHARLTVALAELERIATGPRPERRPFNSARWALSRASLTRRLLWAKILGFLLYRVGEHTAADLRRLQDDDIALLGASTRHVAKWTTGAALAQWPRYCEASHAMRAKMAAGIAAEKTLLYPMLEAVSRGEAVP